MRVQDHSGEQSGIFRGVTSIAWRVVAGCFFAAVAIIVLLAVPWVPHTLSLHIVVPGVFGLLALGFFFAAVVLRKRD